MHHFCPSAQSSPIPPVGKFPEQKDRIRKNNTITGIPIHVCSSLSCLRSSGKQMLFMLLPSTLLAFAFCVMFHLILFTQFPSSGHPSRLLLQAGCGGELPVDPRFNRKKQANFFLFADAVCLLICLSLCVFVGEWIKAHLLIFLCVCVKHLIHI